ncbi:MAG: hypothetical protein ACRD2Y_12930, partial [Terriglobales bacterium]
YERGVALQKIQGQGIVAPDFQLNVAGVITCGEIICGTVRHFEPALVDQSADIFGAVQGGQGLYSAGHSWFARLRDVFKNNAVKEGSGGVTYVIGRMADLRKAGALKQGEKALADLVPRGDPKAFKANWANNFSILRKIMREGKPIRDVTVDAAKNLSTEGLEKNWFLRAERNALISSGWKFADGYWWPPAP